MRFALVVGTSVEAAVCYTWYPIYEVLMRKVRIDQRMLTPVWADIACLEMYLVEVVGLMMRLADHRSIKHALVVV